MTLALSQPLAFKLTPNSCRLSDRSGIDPAGYYKSYVNINIIYLTKRLIAGNADIVAIEHSSDNIYDRLILFNQLKGDIRSVVVTVRRSSEAGKRV